MNQPLQITFRGMEPSEAVSEYIREHAAKLERFFDQIISCHVVVELPHKHKSQGNHFHVRIELGVPKQHIVVTRAPEEKAELENAYATLAEAFKAAERKLQDYSRKMHGGNKHHAVA
jgi:ribosomal subunit interface protein